MSSYEITTRAVLEKREASSAEERKKMINERGGKRTRVPFSGGEMTSMPLADTVELN